MGERKERLVVERYAGSKGIDKKEMETKKKFLFQKMLNK